MTTKTSKKQPRDTLDSLLSNSGRKNVHSREQISDYNRRNDTRILVRLLKREEEESSLRKWMCIGLFVLLAVQVGVVNYIIYGIGIGKIVFVNYEPLRWLFVFVIAEVITLISLIIKYLFGKDATQNLKLIGKYIERMGKEVIVFDEHKEEDDDDEDDIVDFG